MRIGRSTKAYNHPVVVELASHKREVFTLDAVQRDGRTTTSSKTLYLDGKARDFEALGVPELRYRAGSRARRSKSSGVRLRRVVVEAPERFERKLILERQ
jgi:hypothetical protein